MPYVFPIFTQLFSFKLPYSFLKDFTFIFKLFFPKTFYTPFLSSESKHIFKHMSVQRFSPSGSNFLCPRICSVL